MKKSLDSEVCVFMMFSSLKGEVEKGVKNLSVVEEFSEVFPHDINDLPPERGGVCN